MAGPLPWLPLVVLGSGLVSAGFLRYLWPYRDRPGGWFFLATIASETLWILSYGLALFVFDPALRAWFEVPIWLGANFIGVGFLAFALEYTGRGRLVRSPWMAGLAALQGLHTLIVATNPVHGIAWTGYAVTPVFGAATVTYTHTAWLAVNFAGIFLMVSAGVFLLVDAFFSYGPLYRVQAAAMAVSPVLPGLAFFGWLIGVEGSPPLNLTPLTFPIHLGLVGYAFFRRDMFELAPAARRAAERAAVEDLPSAVLVVDVDGRVIDLNAEARRLLDPDEGALGRPLEALLPGVDPAGENDTVALAADGRRREFAVTTGALREGGGRVVGHTVVLQDVTAEREREQRLAVLNRVLRHNLRNDLNVVQGYVELARDAVEDDELRSMLAIAGEKTGDVVDLGEKARRIERTLSADADPGAVRLAPLLASIAEVFEAAFPGGTVAVDVPAGLEVAGPEPLVGAIFRDLIENGLEHDPGDAPRVAVTYAGTAAGMASVAVSDEGPGIPDHELEVLDAAAETALEHGSGLGLWLVTWGVRTLGGSVEFDVGDAGTTATVTLPVAGGVTSS